MADISLVEDDPIDGSDEGVFKDVDSPSMQRENLILVNDNNDPNADIFTRYINFGRILMHDTNPMVSTALMELFEKAPPDVFAKDLPRIIDIILKKMMENDMVTVLQFLEEIPNIAASVAKYATRIPELCQLISQLLLPVIFQNFCHLEDLVRSSAQSALFTLVKKNLVATEQIENQLGPTILELTDSKIHSEYHTEYIRLMCRLVHFLGRDITERVFLGCFSQLCSSSNFCVRKICVSQIGDFCSVVGNEAFENVLLPTYITLCSDEVWGVRKSCAEVIMYLSCACSPAKRHSSLAPVFAKLLQDQSRWVRMSAFRTLGLFISTFADTAITTLAYNNLGELVLTNKDGTEFRVSQTLSFIKVSDSSILLLDEPDFDDDDDDDDWFGVTRKKKSPMTKSEELAILNDLMGIDNVDIAGGDTIVLFEKQNGDIKEDNESKDKEIFKVKVERESEESKEGTENLEEFNSYKYWYVSPEMPLDPSIVDNNPTSTDTVFRDKIEDIFMCNGNGLVSNFNTPIVNNHLPQQEVRVSLPTLDEKKDVESNKSKPLDETIHNSQLVVPQLIIDHFVSMTNSTLAAETDTEMAFHCAYSLPAVALTLGSKNWHLIRHTVEALAANMQYKVRRTVAFSLHELATIVGPDIATNDLIPIFEGFIKDLDEVRIGVLKNLAHFLRMIHPSKRITCLLLLQGFLQTDNVANWRFRQELAEQLLLVLPLFKRRDASKHITFLAHELLCDKVTAVREAALLLVTELIQRVSSNQPRTSHLLGNLAEVFAHSILWKLRQLYALLCSKLLASRALSPEQFALVAMPHLLDLSLDPVPNVRLVVARTLAQHIVTNEYFADSSNHYYDNIQNVLQRLQSDKDRDVRQSADFEKVTNVE